MSVMWTNGREFLEFKLEILGALSPMLFAYALRRRWRLGFLHFVHAGHFFHRTTDHISFLGSRTWTPLFNPSTRCIWCRYWHGWHLSLDRVEKHYLAEENFWKAEREARVSLVSPGLQSFRGNLPGLTLGFGGCCVGCCCFVFALAVSVLFLWFWPTKLWSQFLCIPAVDWQCLALVRQCRKKNDASVVI